MLAVGSALIGCVLALRFRVLVLIPIVMIGAVALLAADGLTVGASWGSLMTLAVFATSLQFGYALAAYLSFVAVKPRRLVQSLGAVNLTTR